MECHKAYLNKTCVCALSYIIHLSTAFKLEQKKI